MCRVMTLAFFRFFGKLAFSARSRQILDYLNFSCLWLDSHEKVNMGAACFRPNGKNFVDVLSIFVPKRDFLVNFKVGLTSPIGTGSRWLIGTRSRWPRWHFSRPSASEVPSAPWPSLSAFGLSALSVPLARGGRPRPSTPPCISEGG